MPLFAINAQERIGMRRPADVLFEIGFQSFGPGMHVFVYHDDVSLSHKPLQFVLFGSVFLWTGVLKLRTCRVTGKLRTILELIFFDPEPDELGRE